MSAKHLYAIHDWEQGWASIVQSAGKTAWCVQSESIGADPDNTSGFDYRPMLAMGITPIARLNFSHFGEGSIPLPDKYDEFAVRCANFVTASAGCTHWIIANETNWADERPNDIPITARQYADCFERCRQQIKLRGQQHQCIVAAVAPYNEQTGWCIDYWQELLTTIAVQSSGDAGADGLALHTYSRGGDPASISSEAKMEAYPECYNGFRAYRDFLGVVPAVMLGLPAYITETNQIEPWVDNNSGWVCNAYEEIDTWNHTAGKQTIHCLALYRWQPNDKWVIEGKQGVIDDFRAALALDYACPEGAQPGPTPPEPTPEPPEPEPPQPLPDDDNYLIEWDTRLDERGTELTVALASAGEWAWRCIAGEYFDKDEAQGRHNTFISVLDDNGNLVPGVNVKWYWNDGGEIKVSETKTDPWLGHAYSCDFSMYEVAPSYGVMIDDTQLSSDDIWGLGLGSIEDPHHKIHTSYSFTFSRIRTTLAPPQPAPGEVVTGFVIAPAGLNVRENPGTQAPVIGTLVYGSTVLYDQVSNGWLHSVEGWVSAEWVGDTAPATQSTSAPVVPSTPSTPALPSKPPQNEQENWERCYAFITKWEGGWADHPADPGGATMKGITIGTYTRWCEAQGKPVPSKEDLRNISDEEVQQIYKEWYWVPSKSNLLDWPLCLSNFNIAVNAGVGRALEFLDKSSGDFLLYNATSISWYTTINGWKDFGAAWTRRNGDVLRESSK